jgi:DNA-binding LacI/PurR family transcriptional regulator
MTAPFKSIAAQVAQSLRDQIAQGAWRNRMPGERQLAARLQVSRRTLRTALAELRSDGTLATRASYASTIARKPALRSPASDRRIMLLLPEPLEGARPFTVLWVNQLTSMLRGHGFQLEVLPGSRYYAQSPARALAQVTSGNPSRCWILARSHRSLQAWFAEAGLPAVVCGSTHTGIHLPSVDLDHRAECRHAAGVFLRQGHRSLALLLERAGLAGEEESEHGFREGVALARVNAPAPVVIRFERSVPAVKRGLDQLLSRPRPPTALLVSNSYTYLTVQSLLGSRGLQVPRDLSLISRDEEPFLAFLHPAPARYSAQPAKFAAALNRTLQQVLAGRINPTTVRLMPEFVPGESVGPAPASPPAAHT